MSILRRPSHVASNDSTRSSPMHRSSVILCSSVDDLGWIGPIVRGCDMNGVGQIAGTVVAGLAWVRISRENVAKREHRDLCNIPELVTAEVSVEDWRVISNVNAGNAAVIIQPSDTRRLRGGGLHHSVAPVRVRAPWFARSCSCS